MDWNLDGWAQCISSDGSTSVASFGRRNEEGEDVFQWTVGRGADRLCCCLLVD